MFVAGNYLSCPLRVDDSSIFFSNVYAKLENVAEAICFSVVIDAQKYLVLGASNIVCNDCKKQYNKIFFCYECNITQYI